MCEAVAQADSRVDMLQRRLITSEKDRYQLGVLISQLEFDHVTKQAELTLQSKSLQNVREELNELKYKLVKDKKIRQRKRREMKTRLHTFVDELILQDSDPSSSHLHDSDADSE